METMQDPHRHPRKIVAARRLTLLGSVAILGAALAFGGPLAVNHAITPALAAMPSQTQNGPAGFADLVTRVKPAVISVRVKMDQSADAGAQGQDQAQGDDEQGMPEQFRNTPFEKFFRQFG